MTKGYGLSVHDIDWSCPTDLEPYAKAHKLEIAEKDELMHVSGLYDKSAFETVMSHFGAGLAGKRSRAKYLEKPITQMVQDQEEKKKNIRKEYKGMTEEQKQKAELERAKDYFNSILIRFPKNQGQ